MLQKWHEFSAGWNWPIRPSSRGRTRDPQPESLAYSIFALRDLPQRLNIARHKKASLSAGRKCSISSLLEQNLQAELHPASPDAGNE